MTPYVVFVCAGGAAVACMFGGMWQVRHDGQFTTTRWDTAAAVCTAVACVAFVVGARTV